MTTLSFVSRKQRLWALRRGLHVDERGYTISPDDSLFEPLSAGGRAQFLKADGGELKPGKDRLPKMQALHSSSALAVNVFHYWRDRDIISRTDICEGRAGFIHGQRCPSSGGRMGIRRFSWDCIPSGCRLG